jgi:hypothetical protein
LSCNWTNNNMLEIHVGNALIYLPTRCCTGFVTSGSVDADDLDSKASSINVQRTTNGTSLSSSAVMSGILHVSVVLG